MARRLAITVAGFAGVCAVGCTFPGDREQALEREVSEVIDTFRSQWKPPSPDRGYGWDYQAAWSDLRDALTKIERPDIVQRELITRIEGKDFPDGLRRELLEMLLLLERMRQEHVYTRLYRSGEADARAAGLKGLARLGNRKAFVEGILLAIGDTKWPGLSELENVKTGVDAVYAYFSNGAQKAIPSPHWDVLWRDFQPDETFLNLARDIGEWWKINKKTFENE